MDIALYDKYILCICECGGLTKAAKKLGISQPALSMSLSNLEKNLGFEIFDRKSKPISLTEEGKLYVDCLRKQNLLRRDCQRKIADLQKKADGTLTIGGPQIYIDSILTEAVIRLRKEFDRCLVTIRDDQVPDLMEDTLAGKMDCFISTSSDLPGQFKMKPVKRERIYLCIPRGWEINRKLEAFQVSPGKIGACMDYKLLDGLDVISLLENLPLQKEMDRFFDEREVVLNTVIRTGQAATAVKFAASGLGMVAATEEVLGNGLYDSAFCYYTLPEEVSGREIFVVYDKNRYLSHICTRFLEILTE